MVSFGIVSISVNPAITHTLLFSPIGAFETFLDLCVFLITKRSQIQVPKRGQKKWKLSHKT
jgi:hypothetical protein